MDALLTPPWGKRRWNLTTKEPDSLREWVRREIYRTGFKKMLEEVESYLEGLRLRWDNLDSKTRIRQLKDIKNYLEMLEALEEERAEKAGECL
jgi:hypothetical protein